MKLRILLREKVASEDSDHILRAMGYSASALPRARIRLHNLLEEPDLGILSGRYDFRFSNREFLRALTHVVGIDSNYAEAQLSVIEADIAREGRAFKPWVFVETDFRRRGEPIFALAVLEGKRRLTLPKGCWSLPQSQLVAVAADTVRTHYAMCQGQLLIWGAVREYWLRSSETEQIVMDVSGKVVRAEGPKAISRACLKLK
jgi:hypothetical protein